MMFDEEEKKRSNINVGMKDVLQKLVDYIQFALTNHQNKETITFTLEILMFKFLHNLYYNELLK